MNKGHYTKLVKRLEMISALPSVALDKIGQFSIDRRDYSMFLIRVGEPGPQKANVMIAAGIHGDEPAGVEAALRFVETNASNKSLLSRFHFMVFPCNNPTGWEKGTRENWQGIDLNREFGSRRPAPEVDIIQRALSGNCFELVFEMHEDVDSPGLYLYEITEESSHHVAETILHIANSMGCPINRSRYIEGMTASEGLIRRRTLRFRKTHVPQAIYTYRTCGGHVITLEPPASVLSFEDRVKIQLTALRITLDATRMREV
ncbi:MAG: M14 family metallocarboxypeptidase [Armatimonadota bacterium]|nr:M14 family metallocarboxypeptidase [bacterium]